MTGSKGNKGIFIVGWDQLTQACDISLNAASALLIMARGSGRDNVTTSWSCNAIAEYAGITRKRATDAVQLLIDGKLVEQTKGGSKPQYKLSLPDCEDSYIFLPNSIIDGVGGEVPPVKRLRQMLDVKLLKLFIQLYALHDLDNEGGLPGDIVRYAGEGKVKHIYANDIISVYGCRSGEYQYTWPWYARSPLCGNGEEDFNDFCSGMRELRLLGLIDGLLYVFEADHEEAELIGPSFGHQQLEGLFKQISRASHQLQVKDSRFFAVVPKHIKEPAFRVILRLAYRPQTVKTARWFALEQERNEFLWSLIDKAERLETARAIEREEDF